MHPVLTPRDLLAPRKVCSGWGRRADVGSLARDLGRHATIIQGSRHLASSGVIEEIRESLRQAEISSTILGEIHHEPRVEDVDSLVTRLREESGADFESTFVLGIGGGAALDLAKAVSAVATNRHFDSVLDGLEGVGRGLEITRAPLPFVAMPTTAGTGSEATKNAVISSDPGVEPPFKKSLRHESCVARLVILDPELTVSCPPEVTARCGLDAITQLIESILSCRSTALTSAIAWHGLELAVPMLEIAVTEPGNRGAREALSQAAFLSGLCLANSGLGLAHGVAPALGMIADVSHGLACGLMLPTALEANREVREAEVARFARLLDPGLRANPRDAEVAPLAPRLVGELLKNVGLPRKLSEVGVKREQLPAIVQGSRGNSMRGNPREVADSELTRMLEDLL